MNFTIVIPFFNGHEHIKSLLESIQSDIPVIIVDDLSDEPLQLNRPNTQVIRMDKKGYFTGAVNEGIKACSTDVLILNQDVYFSDDKWLDYLEKNQPNFHLIGEKASGNHPAWPSGYIHGTFMYMRRDAINKVGLLNDVYYPLWGSTCEWQLRACRKNLNVLVDSIPGFIHKRIGNFGSSINSILCREPQKQGLLIRTPPMVSVIVPSYNHARYIPDLISSLIGGNTSLGSHPGQTFQSFEIIIVDDCSTDNTAEVCAKIKDPYKGIRFIRLEKNSGTSVACNEAIKIAYGKFIARIDSDDMREPESLEYLVQAQQRNLHSFIYDDVTIFSKTEKTKRAWVMPEYDFDKILYKNQVHAGIMFPKIAWKECGGYVEKMNKGRDDWAFNIALGIKGYCGVHVNKAGYLYRREGQNRTLTNTTPEKRERFLHDIQTEFSDVYAGRYPMSCCGGSKRNPTKLRTTVRNSGVNAMAGPDLVGSAGMTLVEYVGGNFGEQSYYGSVTGTKYIFSAEKKRKWVDDKDLSGMLDRVRNGKRLFIKSVKKPVEQISSKVTVSEPVEESKLMEEPEPLKSDFSEITVFSPEDIAKLEKNGVLSTTELFLKSNEELQSILDWKITRIKALRRTFS